MRRVRSLPVVPKAMRSRTRRSRRRWSGSLRHTTGGACGRRSRIAGDALDALDEREPPDRNGLLHLSKSSDRWVLSADLDDVAGTTISEALGAAIDPPADDDPRSPAKRRADALVEICRYFLDHADLPVVGGEAPHVSVVLGWDTIRELIDSPRMASNAIMACPSLSPAQLSALLCDAKRHSTASPSP